MAVREERPYVQFNFTVDLNVPGMDPGSFSGGFQEVSGIGMEVTVAEYRNGSDKDNGVRKITGLNKQADVTLKRGVIGATLLFDWLNEIRNGNQTSFRDVTVVMQNESHEPVLEWRLLRARVTKVTYGPLNAKGNDVAMEEMVLAYERLEMRAR
jgi:phage tail-like protein